MIDPSLIPGHILEMVLEAEDYSEAEWKRVVSGWCPFYQQVVLRARRLGEVKRKRLLLKGSRERLEKCFDFEEEMDLMLTILFLSDASLDKAIAAIPPP